MPSWKEIQKYKHAAHVALAAEQFRKEMEDKRIRSPAEVFISYSSNDKANAQ